eukprot:5981712-Pleurochrysis_carterae.AAC.1
MQVIRSRIAVATASLIAGSLFALYVQGLATGTHQGRRGGDGALHPYPPKTKFRPGGALARPALCCVRLGSCCRPPPAAIAATVATSIR